MAGQIGKGQSLARTLPKEGIVQGQGRSMDSVAGERIYEVDQISGDEVEVASTRAGREDESILNFNKH